ncbi:unnamed protein product, partial [Mesorhabditis spiculigera]
MLSVFQVCYAAEVAQRQDDASVILNPFVYAMPKVADSSNNGKDKPNSCADAMFGAKTQKYALYFIVFFLACLTIKDVVELVQDYAENTKQSDLSLRFNSSMDFPNMTFCMSTQMARSHWKIDPNGNSTEWDAIVLDALTAMDNKTEALSSANPWNYRLIVEAYQVLSGLSSMERETDGPGAARSIYSFRNNPERGAIREMYEKWLSWCDKNDITYQELMQKVGEQVYRASHISFDRHTFDDERPVIRPDIRIRWISLQQMCWSPEFNKENFQRINDQGKFFSLRLWSNLDNVKNLDCMHVDFHGRDSSLNRFMEGKGRARDGLFDMMCFAQHHQLTVEVKQRYTMLENDDNNTACAEMKEDTPNEYDCRGRCRMQMIQKICNCTARTLAHLATDDELAKNPLCEYAKCALDVNLVKKGDFSDDACRAKCFPDCSQTRFDVKHEVLGKLPMENMTYAEIHWGAFEYINMEQSYVWTLWKFIAALGGAIGVWLGLSVLSLIQGIGYIYNTFVQKVVVEKKPLLNEDSPTPDRKITGDRKVSKSAMTLAANPLTSPWMDEEKGQRRRSKPSTDNGYKANPVPTKIVVD